jgi:MOSC domain-containing protein YiiM
MMMIITVFQLLQVIGVFATLALVIPLLQPRSKCKSRARPPLSTESGVAISVSVHSEHVFSKPQVASINLLKGLGVEGDAHCGEKVQHLSRTHIKPPPPNLRQVHLIHSELYDEFKSVTGPNVKPYDVKPGDLGENITTSRLDLLSLGVGTKLHFFNPENEAGAEKEHPVVTVTGLRNPCPQISKFQKGLQEQCLRRNASGEIVERKAGIMTTVDVGGVVRRGAKIVIEKPDVHVAMDCV